MFTAIRFCVDTGQFMLGNPFSFGYENAKLYLHKKSVIPNKYSCFYP